MNMNRENIMDGKRRKRRDFFQNMAIVLLSVSAVLLIAQTQLYTLGISAGSGYLRYLAGDSGQASGSAQAALTVLPAPVRVAVTGAYGGRYGSVTLTSTDEDFAPVSGLLREAFGSVQTFSPCGRQEFLNALGSVSVYCDFLEPLPLPVLAGLVGADLESGETARRVLVSARGKGGAVLYLWGEGDGCLRGTSVIPLGELNSVVDSYEFNGALFALDDPAPDAEKVSPCSLFPLKLPELPLLSAASAFPDSSALLSALGFYPRTNSRYTESGGIEVVTDGGRSLRLSPDGTIRYRSGGEPALTVAAAGQTPTLAEAVTGAYALLSRLLNTSDEGAALYLQSVQRTEDETAIVFGWQYGGVPIRISGGSAAEVILSGSVVSSLSLRFRQYQDAGETCLLLPLRQALAISAVQEGAELSVGYVDDGVSASACWLAD